MYELNNHSVVKVIIGSIQVLGIVLHISKRVVIQATSITIAIEVLNISFNNSLIHLFIILLIEIFYGNELIKLLDKITWRESSTFAILLVTVYLVQM